MNIHIPSHIRDKWTSHEFRGKIKKSKSGYVYMEAYHKVLQQTYYYIFGADSFIDIVGLKNGASELIFDDNNGPIV